MRNHTKKPIGPASKQWLFAVVAACLGVAAPALAENGTPTPLRPATVAWGGYNHNDQLIDSEGKWDFVAKHMDAYLLHGAYWTVTDVKDPQYQAALAALGAILKKHGKTAHYETGFGEPADWDPNVPGRRGPYARAQLDIARMKQWAAAGVVVDKVRVDWFPMPAISTYAGHYQTTDMRQLMARVTGASTLFGHVDGWDPAMGHWREYVTLLNQAFPGIKICFDQAPCNHGKVHDPAMRAAVPWPGFGYGYERPMKRGNGQAVLVNGKQGTLVFDFMDQLMGVKVASDEAKVNYVGFEGDTPYNYITHPPGTFPAHALTDYLLTIERFVHSQGLRSGRFLNDSGTQYGKGYHAWLQIDLGKSPVPIDRVRLTWGHVQAVDGHIEISADGNNWQSVRRLRQEKSQGNVMEIKLDKPLLAKAVRFSGRKPAVNAGYELAEFEVFGPQEPAQNLALHQKASADSEAGTHPAAQAVDGDASTWWSNEFLPIEAWDQLFHDRSLAFLEYWQSVGGRADDYIAESWYDGPFEFFPETKPGTFSNLARDVIRRLRGIDDLGQPMKVSLAARSGTGAFSDTRTLKITPVKGMPTTLELRIQNDAQERNRGDARATPLLRAKVAAGTLVCKTAEGTDITAQVLAQGNHDGWFVGGLEPGQSKVVRLEFKSDAVLSASFELYWNPQQTDPKPRDTFSVLVSDQ